MTVVLPAQGQRSAVISGLHVLWCCVALAAAVGLHLRWRLTGEAPVGLLSAALVVIATPELALSVLQFATDIGLARLATPTTHAVMALPACWLLLRCVRSPQIDSGLHPIRIAAIYGGAAALATTSVAVAQHDHLLGRLPEPAATAIGLLIAATLFAIAWAMARSARAIERPLSTRLAVVMAGLGVATLADTAGRSWRPLLLVSSLLALVSLTLLVLIVASLLRSVLQFTRLRMLSLSLRARSAEETVRREQERMHELRATLAGLRLASGTLGRGEHVVDPGRRRALALMMAAELERLERLLTAEHSVASLGPALLDDVIRPLVVRQREQGASVHWEPSGTYAVVQADAVAEVLSILLTNARVHAPGAAVSVDVSTEGDLVRVHVRDDGPGVPAPLGHRVFERGTHGDDSTGHGLGLHIAQRLAVETGGGLDMMTPRPGGADFVLTLPAVPAAPPGGSGTTTRTTSAETGGQEHVPGGLE